MTTIRPEDLFAGFDVTHYDDRARIQWPDQWEETSVAGRDPTPEEGMRMRADPADEGPAVPARAAGPSRAHRTSGDTSRTVRSREATRSNQGPVRGSSCRKK